MRSLIGIISLLTMAYFIQACAPKVAKDDCGYVQNVNGERISWKGQIPIKLYIHESFPSTYVGAVQAAVKTWNNLAGKTLFELSQMQVGSSAQAQKDGYNVIYFYRDWEADKSIEQARTAVYWSGDKIYEADIKINGKNFSYYWNNNTNESSVNIQALVLHELGHVLGLKHKDSGSSVMSTYLANNTDRTVLAATDAESLKCEY